VDKELKSMNDLSMMSVILIIIGYDIGVIATFAYFYKVLDQGSLSLLWVFIVFIVVNCVLDKYFVRL